MATRATARTVRRIFPCRVTDLSRAYAACTVANPEKYRVSDRIFLDLPNYGSIAAIIRRIEGNEVGLSLIDGYAGELPL